MFIISKNHLDIIYNFVDWEFKNISSIGNIINDEVVWNELPKGVEGVLCGVDGSRGKVEFCSGIVYGLSSYAIGKNIEKGMFELGVLPFFKEEDRVRRLMMTLEYRLATLVSKNVDLILLDGTLSGALIMPPLLSGDTNPLTVYPDLAEDLGWKFIKSLDNFWDEVLENLDGNIYDNTLLAIKIFQKFDSTYSEYVEDIREELFAANILNSRLEIACWGVYFEYIELLHSLNRLLEYDCTFIAKNFENSIITEKLKENNINVDILLDATLLNQIFRGRGYTTLKLEDCYNKKRSRRHINKICDVFGDYFKFLEVIRENPFEMIPKTYVRFAESSPILALEVPRTNKKSIEEVISLLIPYSKLGYPRYLKDAHNKAKISKKEFKKQILFMIKYISEKNRDFSLFFQSGREVLGE
ncbi:DNA double-strand break repair nuclease NurA [Methanocaldococcus jannaschii]|nr:DNA double-strand break repair nuclease NurA [Methanocaldococcus jannaschii]